MNIIRKKIDKQYNELNVRALKLYNFVFMYHNYIYEPHIYIEEGKEHLLSMMDIHTLTSIEESPGITITELAQSFNKTKSAFSQTVTRLEKGGYVNKKKSEQDAKNILLYATELGVNLSYAHKKFDIQDINEANKILLETCSKEDIDSFYKVIAQFTNILEHSIK